MRTAMHFVAPSAYLLMIAMDGRTGGQVPLDLIWNAILGVTDQYLKGNIPEYFYLECCDQMKVWLWLLSLWLLLFVLFLQQTRLANHLDMISGGDGSSSKGVLKAGDQELYVPNAETGHIMEEKEFRFFLYRSGSTGCFGNHLQSPLTIVCCVALSRHWSLYESIYYSPYIASKLSVWKSAGENRLQVDVLCCGSSFKSC